MIGLFLSFSSLCFAVSPSDARLKALYHHLSPTSVSEHLAFYELYADHPLGKQALRDAWQLLYGKPLQEEAIEEISLSSSFIKTLIALVNKRELQEPPSIDPKVLASLSQLSKRLPHFSLKGHHVWSEEEVLALPLEEIDLARAIFLSQLGQNKGRIQTYEAYIDLMALQILARLPKEASPEEKIIAINSFIFDQMEFRFPPHSLHAKEIDLYTFLPSVLDSRRGVCLGVSILYLCLAQRLLLPLEMITPPGHIFVRYRNQEKEINIETTARGIHIDSKEYLGINTFALQKRTLREVIGMAHFNHASVYWQKGEFEKALKAYEKAEPYMKGDSHLNELMGYLLILTGQKEKGEKLLMQIKDITPSYAIVKSPTIEDYLLGYIDAKGIATLFTQSEESRSSHLLRKENLEETLKHYPLFRSGLLNLAMTWIELHRTKEALDLLLRYISLDPTDPEIHYFLSVLYLHRYDYSHAWDHLQKAEAIVKKHDYEPKALKELRRELLQRSAQ